MRNRNEAPATILANTEVFDYLKEKVGERKTRTEAYCDLLDKSLAGFVSPFLRKQDYDLGPCQCHVTVSDLASEWHWHRATVRSFLDTLEAFGQLERIRLAKSVIITMHLRIGLRKSRFDDGSPLVQFFRSDLGGEWAAFIEASKELAELVIDGKPDGTDFGMDEETERLESLRKPFLSLLAKAQEES